MPGAVLARWLGERGSVPVNVFARMFLLHSFLWSDAAARMALSTLAFIGGAIAHRRRVHAFVRIVANRCAKRVRHTGLALAELLVRLAAGLVGRIALQVLASGWNERRSCSCRGDGSRVQEDRGVC